MTIPETDPELLDLLHKKIPDWIKSDDFPLETFKQQLPSPNESTQNSYNLRYFLSYNPGQAIVLDSQEDIQARFHGWIEFVFQKDEQTSTWVFYRYMGFVSGKPFSGKIVY